jgi:gentisate 1,2-dioxygenase
LRTRIERPCGRWRATEQRDELASPHSITSSAHPGETTRKSGTEYTNPTTGQPVYKTMTFFIQMLRPGEKLLPIRQNSSLICTVFQGRGNSMIGDKTFDWEPFDTFCVPGGQWLEHTNISATEDAIILISSDEPTLSKLGFALKHGRDRNGDTVVLESSTRSEV